MKINNMKKLFKNIAKAFTCPKCQECTDTTASVISFDYVIFRQMQVEDKRFVCRLELLRTEDVWTDIPVSDFDKITSPDAIMLWRCISLHDGKRLYDDNPGQAARRMVDVIGAAQMLSDETIQKEQNRVQRLVGAYFGK